MQEFCTAGFIWGFHRCDGSAPCRHTPAQRKVIQHFWSTFSVLNENTANPESSTLIVNKIKCRCVRTLWAWAGILPRTFFLWLQFRLFWGITLCHLWFLATLMSETDINTFLWYSRHFGRLVTFFAGFFHPYHPLKILLVLIILVFFSSITGQ